MADVMWTNACNDGHFIIITISVGVVGRQGRVASRFPGRQLLISLLKVARRAMIGECVLLLSTAIVAWGGVIAGLLPPAPCEGRVRGQFEGTGNRRPGNEVTGCGCVIAFQTGSRRRKKVEW